MAAIKTAASASAFDDAYPNYRSHISAFYKEGSGIDLLSNLKKNNKIKFQELVDNRCRYLESLKSLRNDWISGRSITPSAASVELAKKILVDFSTWLDLNKHLSIPKLLMGPIPTGGIGLELIVEGKFKIYLNIHNNAPIELEVENTPTGHYTEIEIKNNSVEYLIKQAYKYFSLE